MLLFPEVQKRAQEEIDQVLDSGKYARLPIFQDLPFVSALVLEVLRWGGILPLGAPRRAQQQDIYEGYVIPKDTTILPNIWYLCAFFISLYFLIRCRGICHDEVTYPNPMRFDPMRFMGMEPQQNPSEVVFGFGRR